MLRVGIVGGGEAIAIKAPAVEDRLECAVGGPQRNHFHVGRGQRQANFFMRVHPFILHVIGEYT